ncbi:MAG: GrpB family protein [Gaiellaceae bacterium]
MRPVDYDSTWPAIFAAEQARLTEALASWLAPAGIEHVGSTSVPGLKAKPIIDMIAGVRSFEAAREAFPVLESLGYAWSPHRPEAHRFGRDGFHLHLTEPGSDLWRERLAFRDALRSSPALRAEYAAWKDAHAVDDGSGRYDANKRPLVVRVLGERGIGLKPDEERLDPAIVDARRRI